MKQKLLNLAAALLLCSASASAQTDVTSTYLTNADFSEGPVVTADIRGYGKDMVAGDVYGFQAVTGWNFHILSGDNNTAAYPNSAMGGGVLAYGSSNQLKGNNVTAPAWGPEASSVNGLGFFGVWGCGGYYYQDVTFAAGKYKITFPIYCISGTQANTTYTGFYPTSGTNRTVAINTTVSSWVNQTVEFTLATETAGQIRLGYQSTGSGSGANPHLVFDGVKIEYTATVVKDVLANAISAAQKANAKLSDADLTAAISTAQTVYNDENATQEQVNAAAATLNTATELAMSADGDVTDIFLTNADLSSVDGWTLSASAQYHDQGSYQIGGSESVRFAAPTADETHLTSEYAFGFECRWSTNYTSYYQTTDPVPAGVYTLTFDMENVNGGTSNASYDDRNYVEVNGVKTYSSTTEWKQGKSSWTTHTIRVTVNEAAPLTISFGYGTANNNIGSDNTPAIYVSHLNLSYSSFLSGAKAAWDEAKAAAEAAVANSDYVNVTGEELTALNTEIAKAEPTTVDDYNTAAAALQAATATFTGAKAAYDAIQTLNARATAAGVEPYAITSTTTAADINAAIPALENSIRVAEHAPEVQVFNQMLVDYPYEIALGNWTTSGDVKNLSSQHWNGDANATYNEPDSWGSNTGGTSSWTQEITLPAGYYMLQIAGRHSNDSELSVSVKDGENVLATTSDFPAQGTGYGIDMDGNANYDMNGNFANSGNGWGWAWRSLDISLGEEKTITIVVDYSATVGQQWASFTSYVIRSQFPKEKIDLLNAIKAAQAVDLTTNVGTGVFQKKFVDDGTLSSAITTAQEVYDNAYATTETVTNALTTLNNTKDNVVALYEAAELNAPDPTQPYNLVFNCEGHTATGNALTLIPNPSQTQGFYGLKYLAPANTNLAQAFYFVHTTGNKYKVYAVDAEGHDRYITTQAEGYGTTWYDGIRTIDDASKAMEIEIRPNGEGLYLLWNTGANKAIAHNGNDNNDMFTNNTANFQFAETTKASITINTTAAGWGTLMLPFSGLELPAGVTAYSVSELSGDRLTLVDAGSVLLANMPYIIEGAWEENVTGDAQGTELTYTDGLLTGTYEAMNAIDGTYILQKQDETVGFFQVDTNEATPRIRANRAYLTVSSPVKAFFLGGDADAIQSVFTKVAAGEIYDLAGRKVQKMQKGGVYIIDGKKVSVK